MGYGIQDIDFPMKDYQGVALMLTNLGFSAPTEARLPHTLLHSAGIFFATKKQALTILVICLHPTSPFDSFTFAK